MAHSYFSESDAPRDFRISSTESDSNYTKCALCYTMKKNFYCVECIRSGNILHSSMPYSDRFVEKQAKLQRLKANRKYVQDRCESLLVPRNKHAKFQTELKTCRNKIELIKLAIEQRRKNIMIKKQELETLEHFNNELAAKLPRYELSSGISCIAIGLAIPEYNLGQTMLQKRLTFPLIIIRVMTLVIEASKLRNRWYHKRVAMMSKHVNNYEIQLPNQMVEYEDKEQMLAALRRERIRQLTKYIFPVYISYDTSDSLEDMEFLQADDGDPLTGETGGGGAGAGRERIHIISAWLPTSGELPETYSPQVPLKDGASESATRRARAALSLFAQLSTLLAWCLDTSVPTTIGGENSCSPASLCRRVCACSVRVCVCGGASPLPLPSPAAGPHSPSPSPSPPLAALLLLHSLLTGANVDDTSIGRVNMCISSSAAAAAEQWSALLPTPDDAEPEHIEWHASEMCGVRGGGGGVPGTVAPPASLVTSAAASLASMWRGWTK